MREQKEKKRERGKKEKKKEKGKKTREKKYIMRVPLKNPGAANLTYIKLIIESGALWATIIIIGLNSIYYLYQSVRYIK